MWGTNSIVSNNINSREFLLRLNRYLEGHERHVHSNCNIRKDIFGF